MGRVGVVLPDFDEAHRTAPRFGLAFVYVDQQPGDERAGQGH